MFAEFILSMLLIKEKYNGKDHAFDNNMNKLCEYVHSLILSTQKKSKKSGKLEMRLLLKCLPSVVTQWPMIRTFRLLNHCHFHSINSHAARATAV